MKKLIAGIILLVVFAAGLEAQKRTDTKSDARTSSRPPAVFVSKNACPFECCTYREWVASRDVPLHDRPRGRVIGLIKKGEHVRAVTGEVITHPEPFRVTKKENGIPAGATAYLLHPIGEGYWLVWYRSKVVSIEADFYVRGEFKYDWWARVETASGRSGWVQMGSPAVRLPFDNVDACGG